MAAAAADWTTKSLAYANSKLSAYQDQSELSWFCIAFRPHDKILLFPPSKQAASLLHEVVEEHWTVDNESADAECYTLKLSGTPFLKHTGREHAILLKCLCSVILERLKIFDWHLVLATDLSSKTDLTSWYFLPQRCMLRLTDANGAEEADRERERTPKRSTTLQSTWSFVCMSLSKNRQIQLINAPGMLHHALKTAVQNYYTAGMDKQIDDGGDFEIKLNGSPWDTKNRDQIVDALKMLLGVFRKFAANGYHLYGLVNLKETADSLFFEYDRSQTAMNDQYLMVTMDDTNLLRVIGAPMNIVVLVESTLRQDWFDGGLVCEKERIDTKCTNDTLSQIDSERYAFEFKLRGSPWRADAAQIGRSRRLVTAMLDALLAHGWTAVTGLDVSRALNSKSALLFQSCTPVRNLKHACVSPLGTNRLQLTNGPAPLRQLVKNVFQDIICDEKLSQDEVQYELTLNDFNWDPPPQQAEPEGGAYALVRRRMGTLLRALMDAQWIVVASADVAHQTESTGVGEGIHSWFLLDVGSGKGDDPREDTVNALLRVGARIGSATPIS